MKDINFFLLFVVLVFLPVFLKRKFQVGRTWPGGNCAKMIINNTDLKCHHCQADIFYKREALFSTTFLTLFSLNVFNQSGAAYQCVQCGFIHWFSRPKETAINFTYDESKALTKNAKE